MTNAKEETFTTVSDKKGNVLRKLYNGEEQVSYTYTEDGKVLTEKEGEEVNISDYNKIGNITSFTRKICSEGFDLPGNSEGSDARIKYSETMIYDAYGNVKEYNQNGRVYAYVYKNNAARDLESVTVEGITVAPEKDILGRNKGKEISTNGSKLAGEYLYYRKVGDHATNMPSAVYFGQKQGEDFAIRDNVKYEYDKSGNICKIFENGALAVRYEYDSIDRLVREDNKKLGITTLFSYDNCGNITSKRQTAFTLKTNVEECELNEVLYSYDGDKLLSFGGEACEYDEIGNPAKYRGKEVTWEKGRQMAAFESNTFFYDGNGRRIGKNDIAFTYDSNGKLIASSNGLEYLYDNNGVFGIKNNENLYIYRRDAQGNIVALLDSAGNVVVKYVYDALGNHAVLDANGNDISDENHIGNLNPFRYRGYFYDIETGLYYLQTRYYDPEVGRFITIDSVKYLDSKLINGLNLYAYCGNNPVKYVDLNGTKFQTKLGIEIFKLFKYEDTVWHSGRYKITTIFAFDYRHPFAHFGNNLKYAGEYFLSLMELNAVSYNASALSITDCSFTLISIGVDLLDGRIYASNTDYFGVKVGTAKLELFDIGFSSDNVGFVLLDAKATALTVGVYSEYVDAEFLVGSIGATIGFKDGKLTIGASFGIGFEITIKFW